MPGTVTTLNATQGTVENAVQLSWDAVPDATGYKIYKAPPASGGAFDLLATTTTNAYTDSTAGYGTSYYKAVALI